MRDVIGKARREGSAEYFDSAYFVRDRGLEYRFRALEDGTVVGNTVFNPDNCPAKPAFQYYIIPRDAEVGNRGVNSIYRYQVVKEEYEAFTIGRAVSYLCDMGHEDFLRYLKAL